VFLMMFTDLMHSSISSWRTIPVPRSGLLLLSLWAKMQRILPKVTIRTSAFKVSVDTDIFRLNVPTANAQHRISQTSSALSLKGRTFGSYDYILYQYVPRSWRRIHVPHILKVYLCLNSPETVLVLRALSNFESLYLSRSLNRLNVFDHLLA
jgi:hypothetical protein